MPPAAPPELEDIQADAEAFADAAMAARMDRGGAWGEWTGDNDYRMAFEVRIAHALAVARSLCGLPVALLPYLTSPLLRFFRRCWPAARQTGRRWRARLRWPSRARTSLRGGSEEGEPPPLFA